MIFKDRKEAGEKLAGALGIYKDKKTVVYALPRGGVVLGREIADRLNAPLDLLFVGKITHPSSPEYAVGAVSESGGVVLNRQELSGLSNQWLEETKKAKREELRERREKYLAGRLPFSPKNKIAIIVDDGLATGLTMKAAINELKRFHPKKIVITVPVGPKDTVAELAPFVDEIVVLDAPVFFEGAVGAYYENFPQLSDEEVMAMLPAIKVLE